MPVLWKDSVLHQLSEAPEKLQGVVPRWWAKPLWGLNSQNGMEGFEVVQTCGAYE